MRDVQIQHPRSAPQNTSEIPMLNGNENREAEIEQHINDSVAAILMPEELQGYIKANEFDCY